MWGVLGVRLETPYVRGARGWGVQQPFTAYGTLFKKLVIEDLDDEGHILRRRKGVTTVLFTPPTAPRSVHSHPHRKHEAPKVLLCRCEHHRRAVWRSFRRRMWCASLTDHGCSCACVCCHTEN